MRVNCTARFGDVGTRERLGLCIGSRRAERACLAAKESVPSGQKSASPRFVHEPSACWLSCLSSSGVRQNVHHRFLFRFWVICFVLESMHSNKRRAFGHPHVFYARSISGGS